MAYFGADGGPPRFRARRHAPGHRNSPQDCFYASHCPFRISLYKKRTSTKVLVLFWRRWRDSPASLPRSAARTRAPKQSTGLFLCFALPFSNLFIKKRTSTKVLVLFLAQMERFARRPPRFRARRHAPGHRNSPQDCFYASHCPFRISLLKKRTSTKVLVLFLAQMERFELSRRLPTLRP